MAVSRNTLEILHPLREVLTHSSQNVDHILNNFKSVHEERQVLPPSGENSMSSSGVEPVEGTEMQVMTAICFHQHVPLHPNAVAKLAMSPSKQTPL